MFFRDETKIPFCHVFMCNFLCILCPPPTATVENLSGRFLLTMYRNNPGWLHLHRRGLGNPAKWFKRVLLTQFFGDPPHWRKQGLFFRIRPTKIQEFFTLQMEVIPAIPLYHVIPSIINGVAFTRPEAEAEAVDAASLVESFTGGVPMAFFPGSREIAFGKLTGRWLEYHHFSYEIHRLNPGPAIPASYFRLRECKHKPSARLILLMTTRNPAREPPGMVIKPEVNNGINYQPQLVQDFWTINSSYDLLQETLAYKFQRFFLHRKRCVFFCKT